MTSTFVQVWIASTGLLAISLLQFGGPTARRWAPFVGLAGQPAWLLHAAESQALGVMLVTAAYTVVWLLGCVSSALE